jgi:hypothetical protein
MVRPLRGGHPLSGVLSLALLLGPALLPPPATALELDGRTYFRRPPWSVDLISYYTTVWEPWAEYYFTLTLDPQAGASLGGLEITQTRGVDRRFPFDVGRTRAFLGRPRQAGAAVPVEASFDEQARRFVVRFPQPVPPGSTLTLLLKPWHNPATADTYMFQVTAFPAGPNPSPTPLGYGTLRIYMPDRL